MKEKRAQRFTVKKAGCCGVVAWREVERERRTTSQSSPCSRIRFISEKDSANMFYNRSTLLSYSKLKEN
jgi:hypothetical protein